MGAHIFEYVKNLKWVNYMVFKFYLNKMVFKMSCAEQCLGYPLCIGKWWRENINIPIFLYLKEVKLIKNGYMRKERTRK